ncbi:MAG: GMP synthase (glutamine-hydrolyzing), partial [Candidatus Latescibacteria bacterium]|nr:GMP synthase (glutamine-hydrolyzing) [Candidatus Latescibacterota bacterium]NIO77037.1 GMP synthase (glutamine-hydrolyzing) [Candidatus Latescibacterota bacterium]
IRNATRRIYGVQFHPEVVHTPRGKEILQNYLFTICGCKGGWNATSFVERSVQEIRQTVGEHGAILALS